MERSTIVSWATRTGYTAAILVALSTFAMGTATDLPLTRSIGASALMSPAVVHAASRPVSDTALAAAAVPAPAPKAIAPIRQLASWYGSVLQDHPTASGRRFNMFELTAAHRNLPFGTKVKVTNLRNRRSVVVTITDRGILNADRVIDLSYAAARELDMIKSGVDPVVLEVMAGKPILMARAGPDFGPAKTH
jgi:rare lipoprotein A